MTKHIIGLTVFSFIVGVSAIVYALFNVPEIVPVSEVITTSAPHYSMKNSCRTKSKSYKNHSIKIKQAVLDLQTKQFSLELATPDIDEQIALLFISKDSNGTRYITTEYVNNTFAHNGVLRYSSSYNWLNKRKSHENLYVLAIFESDTVQTRTESIDNELPPNFYLDKAVPVTVDYGK